MGAAVPKVIGAAELMPVKTSLPVNKSLSFNQSNPPVVLVPSSNIASTSALAALAFAVDLATLFSGNDCSFYDSILSSKDLTLLIISPN
jgi:hypothetical protein